MERSQIVMLRNLNLPVVDVFQGALRATLSLGLRWVGSLLVGPALVACSPPQDPPAAPKPVALVSQAEALLGKGETEDAMLLLWRALDQLRGEERNAIESATWMSARFLLQEHDPLEAERRAAFALISTRQTAVAKSYRIKKWYETAADRLRVAALYDPEPAKKERGVLAAKRKRAAGSASVKPDERDEPAQTIDALDRRLAIRASGQWRNVDGQLESGPHPGAEAEGGGHWQWTTKLRQEDHMVSVAFRPTDAKAGFNFGLGVGVSADTVGGYRLVLQRFEGGDEVQLRILRIDGRKVLDVAERMVRLRKTKSGYHRLAAKIHRNTISLQLDDQPSVEGVGPNLVRGHVALMVGMQGVTSSAIRYRDLLIGPLPAAQPSEEERRQQALAESQERVSKAVDEAKALMEARKPEAAAVQLRQSLLLLEELPKGILRDNLQSSLESLLKKADPTARKRARAAEACSTALAELADKYLAVGMPRAALVFARQSRSFDPDHDDARIEAARAAIEQWNAEQLLARSAELAPPPGDGKLLRKWFAGGSLLDSRSKAWIVQASSARVENFARGRTMWMPKSELLAQGKAAVHVHLPEVGSQAGFVFDVAGPHDFGTAILSRAKNEMRLIISRWAGGKWIDLANRRIRMDAWQRGAWHQIELEVSGAGVKVSSCGIVVPIQRKRLGLASGRIGLYAGNYGDTEPTIEFRAFVAVPR